MMKQTPSNAHSKRRLRYRAATEHHLAKCVHGAGSPQDSGRQLIIITTGCQASIFPFLVLHIDPEQGNMFIFHASPQSIRAGPALADICC